jgi:cell division septal protein FtsQ
MSNNQQETNVTKNEKKSKKPYADFKKLHPAIQLLIGALGLVLIIIVLSMFMGK